MPAYRLTPRARDGLAGILEYAADRFGPEVAERVLDQLVSAFECIAESPGIGHRRGDLTRDGRIRFWSVGPSLIAYRARPGAVVEVLFVERAERDWEQVLGDPD